MTDSSVYLAYWTQRPITCFAVWLELQCAFYEMILSEIFLNVVENTLPRILEQLLTYFCVILIVFFSFFSLFLYWCWLFTQDEIIWGSHMNECNRKLYCKFYYWTKRHEFELCEVKFGSYKWNFSPLRYYQLNHNLLLSLELHQTNPVMFISWSYLIKCHTQCPKAECSN